MTNPTSNRIGSFSIQCRGTAGLKLYEAAYKLGMSPADLCGVENGERVATIGEIEAMAEFYGGNLDYLMHWYRQDETDRQARVASSRTPTKPVAADLTNVVFLDRHKGRKWQTSSTSEEP